MGDDVVTPARSRAPWGRQQLKRVLVVEDDAAIARFVALALEEEGYKVTVANNGAEGLAALEKDDDQFPRLVLLDMLMPVMDGWEFARRFHQLYDRSVPIVVMTAATNAQERAAQVEADAFLGKPFDLDDLLACVERYTRDRT